MGEESDGDADLVGEDSESESPEEGDEPTADAPGPEPDEPDTGVTEPPVSPPADEEGDEDEDGNEEPPSAPPEDGDATEDSGNFTRVEPDERERRPEPHERPEPPVEPERDGPGNRQVQERPDVSLDPDELDPAEPPSSSRSRSPDEDGERRSKPNQEGKEGETAPMAEDVATSDSIADVADRTEPLEDEEMPLADHIEEMLKRLAVVLVIAGVVSLAVLPFSEQVINFLWNSILPAGESTRPRLYGPLALLLTKLKVASLAGLVIALPVFVYETYLFMRPGLYPHERRYYLAAVPTSLVLAFVGISFAYFLILPVIFEYFLYYSEDVTTIAFALTKTFNLILLLMGYLAIVFQIPLFIMLAIMMGLTTRRWLVARRLYFWGGFLGISFLFSPDPTGMAPIMVATTMVVLFEGTLFLLKWTGR